jgi:hypothetical protein
MDMYRYARSRLIAGKLERTTFLNLLTKRIIKSMSRASSARIHTNRWLLLIKKLMITVDNSFVDEMLAVASLASKSAPLGARRLKLVLQFMRIEESRNVSTFFQQSLVEFEEAGDGSFVIGIASRAGVTRASCGHFTSDVILLSGSAEGFGHNEGVCQTCATTLLNDGTRVVSSYNNNFVLPEFVVSAFNQYGETVTVDRRHPHFTFNEARQLWHHNDWSPYRNLIADYHSSKRKGFKLIESTWFKSNRRAFGCELEVQVTTGSASNGAGRVHDVLNPSGQVGEYCFFERDGSIGSGGFEIITQPAGLDVHAEKFAAFLNNKDVKKGMRSHEGGSCGFHVHVGREYLSQAQIYRMQSFLNDVRNESLIKKIARRYQSGYSRFKPEMAKFTPHGKATGDRYEALNVSGDKTVEFRIFRGSLRYESIMAALEFVNAVCEFCTPGVVSMRDFNSLGFKQFILSTDNRADTKYLRSYLSLNDSSDDEQSQRIAA